MKVACDFGVSRYAKDVNEQDELITVGHQSLPIIKITRAFGKTTITFGSEDDPKQKTFNNMDNVVINEKVYKKYINAQFYWALSFPRVCRALLCITERRI